MSHCGCHRYVCASGVHLAIVACLWQRPRGAPDVVWGFSLGGPILTAAVHGALILAGFGATLAVVSLYGGIGGVGAKPDPPSHNTAGEQSRHNNVSAGAQSQQDGLRHRSLPSRGVSSPDRSSDRAKPAELITTGAYGFSRHPMYTALMWTVFVTPGEWCAC